MNLRFVDWIWHVRGKLPLHPEQSSDDAFKKLNPLFQQFGTTHERADDTLIFRKKDQAAQDKMSIFDEGELKIEGSVAGPVLHYHLTSRILLFCFLAPLLFLGIAQLTILTARPAKPQTEEARKKAAAKNVPAPLNPIDKFLGAPAPEKKSKDAARGRDRKPSTTPAYVFAAIFATLYVIGRILEDRLVKSLFRKNLLGS